MGGAKGAEAAKGGWGIASGVNLEVKQPHASDQSGGRTKKLPRLQVLVHQLSGFNGVAPSLSNRAS